MNSELKSTLSPEAGLSLINNLLLRKERGLRSLCRYYNTSFKTPLSLAASSDVAQYVLQDMLTLFIRGDIIRQVMREAYLNRNGIVSLPVVTTEFTGNVSATSVHLQGYVIKDGGAGINDRGIAWAEFYNPTIEDQPWLPVQALVLSHSWLRDSPKARLIMQGPMPPTVQVQPMATALNLSLLLHRYSGYKPVCQ